MCWVFQLCPAREQLNSNLHACGIPKAYWKSWGFQFLKVSRFCLAQCRMWEAQSNIKKLGHPNLEGLTYIGGSKLLKARVRQVNSILVIKLNIWGWCVGVIMDPQPCMLESQFRTFLQCSKSIAMLMEVWPNSSLQMNAGKLSLGFVKIWTNPNWNGNFVCDLAHWLANCVRRYNLYSSAFQACMIPNKLLGQLEWSWWWLLFKMYVIYDFFWIQLILL